MYEMNAWLGLRLIADCEQSNFFKYYYYINFDLSITIIVWIWGKCPFISKSLDSVGNVYLECAKLCEEVILLQM